MDMAQESAQESFLGICENCRQLKITREVIGHWWCIPCCITNYNILAEHNDKICDKIKLNLECDICQQLVDIKQIQLIYHHLQIEHGGDYIKKCKSCEIKPIRIRTPAYLSLVKNIHHTWLKGFITPTLIVCDWLEENEHYNEAGLIRRLLKIYSEDHEICINCKRNIIKILQGEYIILSSSLFSRLWTLPNDDKILLITGTGCLGYTSFLDVKEEIFLGKVIRPNHPLRDMPPVI